MNKSVLIIDDEWFFIEPLALFLKKNGFDIQTAADGFEGLNKIRERLPDIIILDIMLPNCSGLQICNLIKQDIKYRQMPIIIVTAKEGEKDKSHAFDSGADYFVPKPVDYDKLLEIINEVFNNSIIEEQDGPLLKTTIV
ncbi:MAG: response regulator [Candidatus Neomarinimicrobiota bacterium]